MTADLFIRTEMLTCGEKSKKKNNKIITKGWSLSKTRLQFYLGEFSKASIFVVSIKEKGEKQNNYNIVRN